MGYKMFRVNRLIIATLLFIAATTAAAALWGDARAQTVHSPRIYFVPSLLLDGANQSGEMGILLFSETPISSYEFEIRFDPEFLRVNDVQFLDPPSGAGYLKLGPEVDNERGRVIVGALNYEGQDLIGELPRSVVVLNVTLLKNGMTHLNLVQVALFDGNLDQITKFSAANGIVKTSHPDPAPQRLSVDAVKIEEGSPLTFSFDYRNLGGGDAPETSYDLYVDDAFVHRDNLAAVASGETLGVVRTPVGGWPAVAGSHTARVVVDPQNAIAEADETNNEAAVNFTVEAAATPPETPGLGLTTGWNKIKWPWAVLAVTDVLGGIDAQCGGNTALAASRLKNGWWETYRISYDGVNFNFDSGKTYYLQSTKDCTWSTGK